jgi:7-keto-8-aminopelargonate synthetase-like enzyme
MKPAFKQRLKGVLAERESRGLTRALVPIARQNGAQFVHQGHQYLNFSSNDYLELATDPSLIAAWQEGLSRYGCGSGASPLVTGFHQTHQTLEAMLCEWLGYERAILFNSGFSANQAVLFSLLQRGDLLHQDRLNHASLMEAGILSAATMKRFRHNDVAHVSALLSAEHINVVVTDWHGATSLSQTPIQPLIIGSSAQALHLASALREQGIWVSAIRPPTVPEGTARLRVTLTAGHTEAQIRQLSMKFQQVME